MTQVVPLNANRIAYTLKDIVEQSLERLRETQRSGVITSQVAGSLESLCQKMEGFLKELNPGTA